MKYKKRILLVLIVCSTFLFACGKGSQNADNNTEFQNGSEGITGSGSVIASEDLAFEENENLPFRITVTDQDRIYVEVKKSTYDPAVETDYSFHAYFTDATGKTALQMSLSPGGGSNSQCSLCYGEWGDASKTVVSDYGYEDLGDVVKYTIVLNNPEVTIAGGDNLSMPLSLFESLVTCVSPNSSDEYLKYDAGLILKFDVDYALAEEKDRGKEKIEQLLYQNDDDRNYLTPFSEDYRADIFETRAIIYDSCSIVTNPEGLLVFGSNPGSYSLKPCTVYRVYEYDQNGSLLSYKEKTVFESERDALHVSATLGRNSNHALYFIDWIGENRVPDDFTDEQGLKAICDEYLPSYYEIDGTDHGYRSLIVRNGNTFYFSFVLENAGYIGKEYLAGIGEVELLGDFLGADGVEFSADNCDNEGFIYMESGEETATVYYSKPESHRHNISTSTGENGSLPDDFVVMPYDGEYFAPAGDDYILWYSMYEDYGDYDFNSDAVLISFDSAGNITDARYRLFRPSNMTNPMSELVNSRLDTEGTKLLYQDDTYAYFDISDSVELKEYVGDGVYGERFDRSDLLERSIDEDSVWMPGYGWSPDNGMYLSK